MAKPEAMYRDRFRRMILATSPEQVLEVGCGSGELLRWLKKRGVSAQGIERDEMLVEKLSGRGYNVAHAHAESLPFADASFDIVASEYCAHHFADLAGALRDMLRVARRAVLWLDVWFDLSISSQRVNSRWDAWSKRIDRRCGGVHNDVISAGEFLDALPASAISEVEFQHWLRPAPFDLSTFDSLNSENAARATPAEADEFAHIRAEVAAGRMTDDGAIVVRVDRRE